MSNKNSNKDESMDICELIENLNIKNEYYHESEDKTCNQSIISNKLFPSPTNSINFYNNFENSKKQYNFIRKKPELRISNRYYVDIMHNIANEKEYFTYSENPETLEADWEKNKNIRSLWRWAWIYYTGNEHTIQDYATAHTLFNKHYQNSRTYEAIYYIIECEYRIHKNSDNYIRKHATNFVLYHNCFSYAKLIHIREQLEKNRKLSEEDDARYERFNELLESLISFPI
jgi:hypothetical protein